MGLNVKTDQVCSEQSVEQFALPGTDAECFGIWPGNVPEDRDASIGPLSLDHLWQQGKVVILDQERRLFRARHLFQHGFSKLSVHLLVMFPVLGPEQRPCVCDMTK